MYKTAFGAYDKVTQWYICSSRVVVLKVESCQHSADEVSHK